MQIFYSTMSNTFRTEFSPSRAHAAALDPNELRYVMEFDRTIKDRGSVMDVVTGECLRAGYVGDVNDVIRLLLCQHLRCAACGISLCLRRFADDDPDRFRLSRVVTSDPPNITNSIALCLMCDMMDLGHMAMNTEISSWRDYGHNAIIEAPLPPTCHQPMDDDFFELDDEPPKPDIARIEELVMSREPSHFESLFDSVRG